ncbi:MAG: TolC family protein [Deferrisomatales bacterium]|nr:TolC family protein [Deferrisomatales bacterium]
MRGTVAALGSAFLAACAAWGSGCAHVPAEAGFGDLQREVGERVPYSVAWHRNPAEAEVAAQAVDALLAEPLTADAAARIALLNDPALQAAYEELGVAQADVVRAALLPNPTVAASVRFPDVEPRRPNWDLGVSQSLLDVLLLPARRALAEEQFEGVKLEIADRALATAAGAKRAYYEVLGAAQVAASRAQAAEAASLALELARRTHGAGNLSDLELARERDRAAAVRVAWVRAEGELAGAREALNRRLGLWGRQTGWTLPAGFPELPGAEPPLDRLESEAVVSRLDLAAARIAVGVRARALGLTADWRWLGSLELGAGAERETGGRWLVGPNASVELPLFHQRQPQLAAAEARLRQSRHQLAALAVRVRSEVREARDRLLRLRDLAEHYRDVVLPLREEIVTLTQQEYNYMLASPFDLLAARRSELEAREAYAESLAGYWGTRAELERAVGRELPLLAPAPAPREEEDLEEFFRDLEPSPPRAPHPHHGGRP